MMNLSTDEILYADMNNARRLGADIVYEDEHALLMRDKHSDILYCAADEQKAAQRMVKTLPEEFDILVSHDAFCNDALYEIRGITYENRCYHCAYLSKEQLPIHVPKGYLLSAVNEDFMEDVIRMYKEEMPSLANKDYMGQCMRGGMYGIFKERELCAFISVHEGGYGSIGMLEVKKEYRRKGFGVLLERFMINEQIRRDRIPYGEIFIENTASLKLQEKAGMQVGEKLTYWYYQ